MSLIYSLLSTIFHSLLITAIVLLGLYAVKLLTQGKCKITKDLTGQIVIVTGSNTGIGKETVCVLAKMGATVILACRSPEKSAAALQEIQKRTGSSKVEFMQLDLADLHSVKRFVETFKKKYDKLHILINNAGALIRTRETTKDGYEAQFGTNHLGHFYLTTLLLDTIKKSGPSRIINVSSDGHYICTGINRESLLCENGYIDFFVYCRTKFANVVFTKDLQSRLEGENVKVVSLHPGMVRTELTRAYHEKWYHKMIMWALVPIMYTAGKSIEEGIQTTLYCALEDLDKLKGGAYYRECKPRYENPAAHKKENWVKLWDLSEELIDKAMKK